MTIYEAITHAEEVMMENLEKTKDRNASDPTAIKCFECADEHRQLAEWMKDYKRLLGAIEDIKAEIQTKYDSIPYRNNQYDDAWIDALEWVLESVFEKHISGKD